MVEAESLGRRERLLAEIAEILASAHDGRIHYAKESQSVDLKEEAGRRNGRDIEPGKPENQDAAVHLADEVACMANSADGGALIVGVADKSGDIIGTELDVDWLRQQIHQKIDVAPDITERLVDGQRLLVIIVAPAAEPVVDTHGRLRWRVGDACKPVDRAQWWEHRRRMHQHDEMAQDSHQTLARVRSQALDIARKEVNHGEFTAEELLRRLGALDSHGTLTVAGALLFTAMNRVALEVTIMDVPGGQIRQRITTTPEFSLLEQLDEAEKALKLVNRNNTVIESYVHTAVPEIPTNAVREAILNALIHRDWNRDEPTDVRWLELDSTLVVRSPGGFPPSITEKNVLSNRNARYPALADLFRAVGLVDKQGVGVDRMYQAMITLGHRPPIIEEVAGPFVETTLVGGKPVLPVLELVAKIVPIQRRADVRIAIILYLLFHYPFVTEQSVAAALQSSEEAARIAIAAAAQTTVTGEPLLISLEDAWLLGEGARKLLKQASNDSDAVALAPYLGTDARELKRTAQRWCDEFGEIATRDLMALAGVSRGTAKAALEDLIDVGKLRLVGGGRSTRYVKD